MFRRFANFLVILAAVQVLGGHWLALQSAAWIGMVATFSRSEPLAVAVSKTFSGANPCDLCKAVKDGRNQEEKQESTKVISKIEGVLFARFVLPMPNAERYQFPVWVSEACALGYAPPVPPPRA